MIEKDKALFTLGPHLEALQGVVEAAWAEWCMFRANGAAYFDETTRANVVHAALKKFAARAFANIPGVHVVHPPRRPFVLSFEGNPLVMVRLKKLDRRLVPRTYPTQQALDLDAQLCLWGSDGVITIGYTLDAKGELNGIYLVATQRRGVLDWTHRLDASSAPSVPVLDLKPVAPAPPAASTAGRRRGGHVRSKNGEKRAKEGKR